ncbi:MAG TPA: recombinase family protein [Thermoplasmata archaeon]|nr:recombinase family protein [Thermoplasmata archaeon]
MPDRTRPTSIGVACGGKVTRAAIYARVSRPDERDILENQKRALRDYCRSLEFELSEENEYFDVASGGTVDRPGFGLLLQRAAHPRRRTFDLVVFTSLSRMTRGGISAALDTLRVLEREGVSWHFVDQPTLNFDATTPKLARDIILAVLAAVDEDYRRNISQKTRAAAARKRALAAANGTDFKWGRPRKRVPPSTTSPGAALEIAPISDPT